jgi:hypothetical protein
LNLGVVLSQKESFLRHIAKGIFVTLAGILEYRFWSIEGALEAW